MVLEPFKLTPQMKKELLDLTADIKAVELEIKRAARAGLDVTELQKDFEKGKKLREGILKEYS